MSKSKKISTLTQEQLDLCPKYVEKWLEIGLSTDPIDFDKAVEALKLSYDLAGLEPPKKFFRAKSPVDAIRVAQEYDSNVTKDEVYNSMIYGCQDATTLSFYNYFQEVLNIEECNKLNGLFELAKHAGWCCVFDEIAIIQDRPEVIRMDERNLLHCEVGPAIRYSDGFSVYAWHGVRIPAEWIEKRATLDPQIALTWENIEQRRCACEIIGWDTIISSLKSKIIDEDEDPMIGTLYEVDIPEIGKEKFLRVLCGTGRSFALPVPPEMTTAVEANAWTYDIDVNNFLKPEVRT